MSSYTEAFFPLEHYHTLPTRPREGDTVFFSTNDTAVVSGGICAPPIIRLSVGRKAIVRVDPFRTNVTQRQMRDEFDARFWLGYFWVVLSDFQWHTSYIRVVESIGRIESGLRLFRDPLYEMTYLMRQMRHAFDA